MHIVEIGAPDRMSLRGPVPPAAGVRGAAGDARRRRARRRPTRRWRQLLEEARAALRLHAAQHRPPRARRCAARPHPDRRARLLSAVRHPRGRRCASGYEVDVARAIAQRLGVEIEFVRVNAATPHPDAGRGPHRPRASRPWGTTPSATARCASSGRTTTSRRRRWSGPRRSRIADWNDVAGRTICVTVGNGSNAELVSHNARLMLFDEAGVLPDRLKDETCTLAAQDDSFFAYYFTDPAFADRFEQKFGFAQVPWGMARGAHRQRQAGPRARPDEPDLPSRRRVPRDRPQAIASARPSSSSQQRGLAAARLQHRRPAAPTPACVLPALNAELKPTPLRRQRRRRSRTGSRSGSASTSPCRCSRPRRPGRCS